MSEVIGAKFRSNRRRHLGSAVTRHEDAAKDVLEERECGVEGGEC